MDACRNILLEGLAQLNLNLDSAQIDQLLTYISLIEKWNKAYNLTAVRDRQEMVTTHLLDSLAILPHLTGSRLADIGTGAGLPGIPLAICRPDWQLSLVDSNSKKTRFVQQAVLELKLSNVEVVHARVESLQPAVAFDTVLCRAFASMPDIVRLCRHLLTASGQIIAMKGQTPHEELMQIAEDYQVIALRVPGIEAERCLVKMDAICNG